METEWHSPSDKLPEHKQKVWIILKEVPVNPTVRLGLFMEKYETDTISKENIFIIKNEICHKDFYAIAKVWFWTPLITPISPVDVVRGEENVI